MRVLLPEGASLGAQRGADPIAEILKTYKTIAVVGLSSNPMRPSYGVTEYMQRAADAAAPYQSQHRSALLIEFLMAKFMGMDGYGIMK